MVLAILTVFAVNSVSVTTKAQTDIKTSNKYDSVSIRGNSTKTITNAVNVREEPSTTARKLGVLYPGDKVTYVGYYGVNHGYPWAIIKYKGRTAYILYTCIE
ncbi:MAG: SH3 domain-containing protein [Clostridium sp.]|nr:SH3 domain-containing protein [Clostridium sp.]